MAMEEFDDEMRPDQVRISLPSSESDDDGAPLVNDSDATTPVTIACQVTATKRTAPVSYETSEGAPQGVVVYDIMFGKVGYDALVAGGIIVEADGNWIAANTLLEWLGDSAGTFTVPIFMRAHGPVDRRHGNGARNTITATFAA